MDNENKITIITAERSHVKDALPSLKDVIKREVSISPEQLSKNLRDFLDRFRPVITEQPEHIGGFRIDEIELSLAINAKGGVELIGKAEVGVEGGISLKLRRPPQAPHA